MTTTTTASSPTLDRAGYTIQEWCSRYGVKRGLYYRLEDKPEVIRLGSKVVITKEADQEWRDRQRAKSKAERHSA